MKKNKLVFWLPLFLLLAFLIFRIINKQEYFIFIQEDGLVEYLQSFFYLLTAALGAMIANRFLKNRQKGLAAIYLLFSLALIFIAGEEISWGQRIFNLDNPDFFTQHNTQKEINFHNLGPVQNFLHFSYILIGLFGAFGYCLAKPLLKKYPQLFNNLFTANCFKKYSDKGLGLGLYFANEIMKKYFQKKIQIKNYKNKGIVVALVIKNTFILAESQLKNK